jgi:DNA adenine methylase
MPEHKRYVEPFCGSAAVFFALRPDQALLADAIEELIVCFEAVRDDPAAVTAHLDQMPNTRAHFNCVRRQMPSELCRTERAARVIYLNKTAFRGLWRVNRKGEFNTPYGDYDRPYYNRETLLAASAALQSAQLRCADFRDVLDACAEGDWVYLDPPYVPDRQWGDFTRYTPGQFGRDDQEELSSRLADLSGRPQYLVDGHRPIPELG